MNTMTRLDRAESSFSEEIESGAGFAVPPYFSVCSIKIISDSSGTFANDSVITYQLGSPCSEVDYALERALLTMREGEIRDITLGSRKLRVLLDSFTSEPAIYEMSITEKWRRASDLKQRGIDLYQKKEFRWAFYQFSLALKYIISLDSDIPEEGSGDSDMNITALRLNCYLNLAACQLKNKNYEAVVDNCTKALGIDADNSKAYYRRGVANLHLQWYERAKQDLERAKELDADNPSVKTALADLKERMKEFDGKMAVAMKKMFS